MNFRSDNEGPAAPEILEALQRVNQGSAHAYGDDTITAQLKARFNEIFAKEVEIFPVATGTAANALCIAQLTPAYAMALCHEESHLNTNECGAPEFYSGGKLIGLPGEHGKVSAATVQKTLSAMGAHGPHESKPAALSITQASEWGTVYRLDEIATLSAAAHNEGLGVHMDGARFANALVSLGCTPAEMTWQAGVDILSFGATKNGALAAEAVVIFEPRYAHEFARRRKRAGQLFSKMRYVSAQLEAYLQDDLWLRLARQSNEHVQTLLRGLQPISDIQIVVPAESNQLFVRLPDHIAGALRQSGFEFHKWPGSADIYRLVTTFTTAEEDVEKFVNVAAAAA